MGYFQPEQSFHRRVVVILAVEAEADHLVQLGRLAEIITLLKNVGLVVPPSLVLSAGWDLRSLLRPHSLTHSIRAFSNVASGTLRVLYTIPDTSISSVKVGSTSKITRNLTSATYVGSIITRSVTYLRPHPTSDFLCSLPSHFSLVSNSAFE